MIDTGTFGFMLQDVARMARTLLEQRIASAGLGVTPGEARALIHIAALEGGRQTRIAERMGVEPMTACGYIDRLEKQGLVARMPDPTDRRAKNVVTTQIARTLIEDTLEQAATLREEMLSGLSPVERDAVMQALRHVRGNLLGLLSRETADTDIQ